MILSKRVYGSSSGVFAEIVGSKLRGLAEQRTELYICKIIDDNIPEME